MIRIDFKYLFIFIVLLTMATIMFFLGRNSNADEISSYQSLIKTERMKAKVWQDNSGYWHSRSETAELKSNESLKYLATNDERFANLSREFEGVKDNLKNLRYAGFTGTTSGYTIHTSSRDTIYISHSDTSKAKYFSYMDSTGWFSVKGYMLTNGAIPYLDIQTRDSLVTVLTRKKKLFRKPVFTQEIKSYNPHTKVTYNQSVIVNKPKKSLGIF